MAIELTNDERKRADDGLWAGLLLVKRGRSGAMHEVQALFAAALKADHDELLRLADGFCEELKHCDDPEEQGV